ncbi:hypothetical protein SAMN05443572_10470 [Myxococcus fulvus]|uniref:Uncharacterized protein n=1 Tax=Myxococcus fulvus TaxID=33 RepID=A0A511T1Q6_MYXFU|nr:hypothetical protein [Myxococcus fulvus]GEN07308.1 hypothetical protein MFU01_23450 [Myxococcus fulvus]SET95920.1 hypothetical protein SAMN05443572_10470 [Myxococcus fulvus]
MSERTQTAAALSESRASEGDLRRRLEGRVELIESALRCYRLLAEQLESRRWRRKVCAAPSLLREVRELEGSLTEALERTERRCELEGWPADARIPTSARRVRDLRARVSTLVDQRLDELLRRPESLPLRDALVKLEEVCLQDVSLARTPGEPFSLRIGSAGGGMQYVLAAQFVLGLFLGMGLFEGLGNSFNWGMALVVTAVALWLLLLLTASLLRRRTPGVLWLTPERLVWLAPGGEPPVVVRLDSLGDGAVEPEGLRGTLTVRGDRYLHLPRFGREKVQRLRVLLELFRVPQVRANASRAERPVVLVTYPAQLRRNNSWTPGQLVLSHRGAYFLPGSGSDVGAVLLKVATGRRLDSRVELTWVLDALRWQPESELDAWLARAIAQSNGAIWASVDVRVSPDVEEEQDVHLSRGKEVLVGKPDSDDRGTVLQLLHGWGVGG